MHKTVLPVAAVIAAIGLAGAAWLGTSRPAPSVGGPSAPVLAPSLSASPPGSGSPSASPSASLAVHEFPIIQQPLISGGTYRTTPNGFSQPMTFTLHGLADGIESADQPNGLTYGTRHTIQINAAAGWAITIHDDANFAKDLCQSPPSPDVQELPATPEAILEWFHEQQKPSAISDGEVVLDVTDHPDLTVDGRAAKVFDVRLTEHCNGEEPEGRPDVWFSNHEFHRIYAIPTGVDTILVITWNSGESPVMTDDQVIAIADRVVQSMDFD